MIKDWTKIRYGMSADFYVKVIVTQVFMDEVFREIIFPNAYMRDFTETINPNTGEGSFVITLLQKIDKVGDIVFQPFDEEFREDEVNYEETLDSVKFMSTEAINEEQGEIAGDYYYIGSEDYYNNINKNENNEAINLAKEAVNYAKNLSIINGYSNKSQNKVVPVILKYIAEKKGYTVKTAVSKESKSCIEMYKNNKVEREVYQYCICNSRAFVTTKFFNTNFNGWNEKYHETGDSFERVDDAIMALGCIYYGKGLKNAIFKINKISEKNFKIGAMVQSAAEKNSLYCKMTDNYVYKYVNGKWESVCNMDYIMKEASKAWGKKPEVFQNQSYTYYNGRHNGISLHVIKTHASNIGFACLNKKSNLSNSNYFGINGGWFATSEVHRGEKLLEQQCVLQNIASENGKPLIGPFKEAKDGRINCNGAGEKGSGTLVYSNNKVQCLRVQNVGEINNGNFIWAQGGVSMTIEDDLRWENQAKEEALPSMSLNMQRTGMIADNSCHIYLIVTDTGCSSGDFRVAIKDYIKEKEQGSFSDYKGIFLDGSTCSQMKCKDTNGKIIDITYPRYIAQIIYLKNELNS